MEQREQEKSEYKTFIMSSSKLSDQELNVLRDQLKKQYMCDKNGNLHQQYQENQDLYQVAIDGIEILLSMLERGWEHKKVQSRSVNKVRWNMFDPANFHLNLEHDVDYTFEVNCCRPDSRFKPRTVEETVFFNQLDDKFADWLERFNRIR